MASAAESELVKNRELRILLLHNRDFDSEPPAGVENTIDDLVRLSRADVLNAAQSIARALAAHGHFVEVHGIDRPDLGGLLDQLHRDPPDLVFNLIESLAGEDRHAALVSALLDLCKVPYTGSAELALALCCDKYRTKQILRAASVATPPGALLPAQSRSRADDLAAVAAIGYPLFLKLAELDGSVGVTNASLVRSDEEFLAQLDYLRNRFHEAVLAERFIDGREIYVSMIGNQPPRLLPMQELDFSRMPSDLPHIVNENAKWNAGSREYQAVQSVGAGPMPAAVHARVLDTAARSFAMLGVRDYGRCDMRLSSDGTPYVIDVNPNCDLTDDAGFARAGRLAGLSYDRLIEQIALAAYQRSPHVQRTGDDGHDDHSQ
jgi:D-alanine-D-alanine ligase